MKQLLRREAFWTSELDIIEPYGLNAAVLFGT